MTTTASLVLKEARKILDIEGNWCPGRSNALDIHGCDINPTDPQAVQWSLWGALLVAGEQNEACHEWAEVLVNFAAEEMGYVQPDEENPHVGALFDLQDRGKHADVLLALDTAIEMAAVAHGDASITVRVRAREDCANGHIKAGNIYTALGWDAAGEKSGCSWGDREYLRVLSGDTVYHLLGGLFENPNTGVADFSDLLPLLEDC